MKHKYLLTILLVLLSKISFAQQDVQFSQYMFNGLYINPAYAGYKEVTNIQSSYRTQWANSDIEGTPRTISFVGDLSANDGKMGFGLLMLGDQLGAEKTFSAYGNYAYRLNLGGSSRLAFGTGIGVIQYSVDGSKLNPLENDPNVYSNNEVVTLPDIKGGIYYSSDKWYAGFSADNLIAEHINHAKDPTSMVPVRSPHFYATAGSLFNLSNNVKLKPSFLVKKELESPTTLDINSFVLLSERIWLGASYRTGLGNLDKYNINKNLSVTNSMVAMTEFYVSKNFRLGYSFDWALNDVASVGGLGSHELSLGYSFTPKKVLMQSPRYF